jgi:hypothetical protein
MKCPACNNELSHIIEECSVPMRDGTKIELDICKGRCGGIWFDKHEFLKFDKPQENVSKALLEIKIDPNITINTSKKRNCPRCETVPMVQRFSCPKRKVEIDECYTCAGIWLDAGELLQIRNSHESDEEQTKHEEKLFEDIFGEDLKKLNKQREENKEKRRRFANMFKFICPSAYMSGKQDWGAF